MRHRRSHLGWICTTAAPWALATGLLVSFTASAGNDLQAGVSLWTAKVGPALLGSALVPPSGVGASLTLLPSRGAFSVLSARSRPAPEIVDHGLPPRDDVKGAAGPYPLVDRSGKGNPGIASRPALSRSAGLVRERVGTPLSRLMFTPGDRAASTPSLAPRPEVETEAGFLPWPSDDTTRTRLATAARSPAAAASGSTGPGRPSMTPSADGATPAVRRAVALSSATPVPADGTPIEIAAAPVSSPHLTTRLDGGGRTGVTLATRADPDDKPRYADLIDPDRMDGEQRCLAQAVYFEARSESEQGQAAVAQVVLNRVKSGLYPSSVCGVVYQNRHRYMGCQFSFACEGKSLRIADGESWQSASRVAKAVLDGKTYLAEVGGATHYHADYVRPNWARRLKRMDIIGRHIFYQLKPGQT